MPAQIHSAKAINLRCHCKSSRTAAIIALRGLASSRRMKGIFAHLDRRYPRAMCMLLHNKVNLL